MNSSRSIRSNASIGDRASPNFLIKRSDNIPNRSSSPPLNNRSSLIRLQDTDKNEPLTKNFNEDDIKYHKIAFERCIDLSERGVITNRERFIQALNYVGYDLPKATIDQLWSTNHEEITFKSFERILNQEKSIDERILQEAFETLYSKDKKFDWNIDFNKFRTDMIEKGDRLTEVEFEKLRRLLGTEGGKIDVKKLTRTIGENKDACRQKIIIEKKEQRRDEIERASLRPNSPKLNNNNKNNVQIRIDSTSQKLVIPSGIRSIQIKGAFFCEYFDSPTDALYFSIGYSFEIKKNTSVWITLKPITSPYHAGSLFKNLDVRLLLFEKLPRSTERRLIQISSARSGIKSYIELNDLPKGSYEIIPITFGGVLRPRTREVNERPPIKTLRETRGKKFSMSKDYRDALEYIFDVFDFNDNKQLDRNEYNLWTIRTTGEEITNEDWLSIRDHVRLDEGEGISKENFFKLNDFEVQDPDTTETDLWAGLKSIGFNYALELDMMCPFELTVHVNESNIHLESTSFVELTEIKKILIKFLQNKSEKIKINSTVQCFNYHDDYGSILIVENKGPHNVRISAQVVNSNNAALTLPIDSRKPPIINIRHETSQIIWFAHKLDSLRPMELDANVQVQ